MYGRFNDLISLLRTQLRKKISHFKDIDAVPIYSVFGRCIGRLRRLPRLGTSTYCKTLVLIIFIGVKGQISNFVYNANGVKQ